MSPKRPERELLNTVPLFCLTMQNSKHPQLWIMEHPQWDWVRTSEWKLACGTVLVLKPTEYAIRELCSENN
jgi:hypothetical protein